MSERKFPFVEGEYYHIYNRGNNKNIIFKNQADYERFELALIFANSEKKFNLSDLKNSDLKKTIKEFKKHPLVAIGAFVLMPNHFHILIKEIKKDGASKFMKKLSTAYVMYFNFKYKRTGGLFEGKFKAKLVDDDNHLKYLFSYISMNPLKLLDANWKMNARFNLKKFSNFLREYENSSYLALLEERPQDILDLDKFPEYFSKKSLKKNIFEWINLNS